MVFAERMRLGKLAALAVSAVLLSTAIAAPPLAQSARKGPDETPEQYPTGPHRDDAFYFCTACHSFRIVAQQGMSRDRWDESLDWMVERHKMPDVKGEDRRKILDYLSIAFPEKARPPGGWKNPFAPQ